LRVSAPWDALISVSVRRVSGRTAIMALPTSSRAVLLKPVEITVSALTCAPAVAGAKAVAPAAFSSTVPLSSFTTPFWAKTAWIATASKIAKIAFFIFSSTLSFNLHHLIIKKAKIRR